MVSSRSSGWIDNTDGPTELWPPMPEYRSHNPPDPGLPHTTAYVAIIFHGSAVEWSSLAASLSSDPRIRTVGATVLADLSCGLCVPSSSQPGTRSTDTAHRRMMHNPGSGFPSMRTPHEEARECVLRGCIEWTT